MRVVTGSPTARLAAVCVLGLVLAGGAAVVRGTSGPRPAPGAGQAAASLGLPGAAGPMTADQVVRAARTCAAHATAAGWANNGSYGGNLVTAAAVCVAESGGQPNIYFCDATGKDGFYPPVNCPGGSYDRGLWQLNSEYQADVPDSCAFRAQCNANAAYRISAGGTSFAPWTVYGTASYASYLGAAQAAVTRLAAGTVTSALFGVCLARAPGAGGDVAVVGRCGRGISAQQWERTGGGLRQHGRCLTAGPGAGQPAVTVRTCTGSADQMWDRYRHNQLRNSQNGECLDDPAASVTAGTALDLAACTVARGETWWLP